LFTGGDEGGASRACPAARIETCKLNGVDPQTYFSDFLTRLVNVWPQKCIDELMPWHWAPQQSSEPSEMHKGRKAPLTQDVLFMDAHQSGAGTCTIQLEYPAGGG
jgi:hypothetical protein